MFTVFAAFHNVNRSIYNSTNKNKQTLLAAEAVKVDVQRAAQSLPMLTTRLWHLAVLHLHTHAQF